MPVNPALGRLRQEFEASMGYLARLSFFFLKKEKKTVHTLEDSRRENSFALSRLP